MESKIVGPFTMRRHFKGAHSFVITVDGYSEIVKKLVVYHCADNNRRTNHKYGIYAIPPDLFLSKVNHEKYPDTTQKTS